MKKTKENKTQIRNTRSTLPLSDKRSMRNKSKVVKTQKNKKKINKEIKNQGISIKSKSTQILKKAKTKKNYQKKKFLENDNIDEKDEVNHLIDNITVFERNGAIVDCHIKNSTDYIVVKDKKNFYKHLSVTLNYCDLKNNNNKFYIMQVLYNETKNKFIFYRRWGRNGYAGSKEMIVCDDYEEAADMFQKKYDDKTTYGYKPINIDFNSESRIEEKHDYSNRQSNLKKPLEELIELIFDVEIMNNQMREIGYNSNKLPLGKLGNDALNKGYCTLIKIEEVLCGKEKADLYELSSEFYSNIPHSFGFNKMSQFVINDKKKLHEKIEMLESLRDIEVATKILDETKETNTDSLFDNYYKKLNCEIRLIDKENELYKLISLSLDNTTSDNKYLKYEIIDIFNIFRDSENYNAIGNKRMLWYGTRITNYVSILSNGFKFAPSKAPISAFTFGNGIYFSDMASKSMGQCHPSNGVGIILLCEVALGNYMEFNSFNPLAKEKLEEAGKLSAKACGKLEPGIEVIEEIGWPLGRVENKTIQSMLSHNEYVIYNLDQIKIRYLIKIKFTKNK